MDKVAERVKKIEQDIIALQEVLKALLLKDCTYMHDFGARCITGEFGNGEQDDYNLGILFYRKGAMLGDIECQWDYAMMLYSGEHMPQDKRKALYWFKKAAENLSAKNEYEIMRKKDSREMYEIVKKELRG